VASLAQAPRIDKIDPPGWWAGLPNPMLLLNGEGLNGAQFELSGAGVTLERTRPRRTGTGHFCGSASRDPHRKR
jgi:hypothetical protein